MTAGASLTPRKAAFGEGHGLTPVDRFGIWLSARRLRRHVPRFDGLAVADVGCGYEAAFARTLLGEARALTLVDVRLAPDLKADRRVAAFEGDLNALLAAGRPSLVPEGSQDVVMCVSVLEHLTHPRAVLAHFHAWLKPGGKLLLNVPSWRGKWFLETSAFKLGLSPKAEMDDHKMYYDPRDLWPMLVEAGFLPSRIRLGTHKFGLNTFAACTKV